MTYSHRLSSLKRSSASLTAPCSFTAPRVSAVRLVSLYRSSLFPVSIVKKLTRSLTCYVEDTPLAQMWAGVRTLRYADVRCLPLFLFPLLSLSLPYSLPTRSLQHPPPSISLHSSLVRSRRPLDPPRLPPERALTSLLPPHLTSKQGPDEVHLDQLGRAELKRVPVVKTRHEKIIAAEAKRGRESKL